jgi:hypothetical protein
MATAAARKRVAPVSDANLADDLCNNVGSNFSFKHTTTEPYVANDVNSSGFTLRATYLKKPKERKTASRPYLTEFKCKMMLQIFFISATVFTSIEEAKHYIPHYRNLLETLTMGATQRSEWIENKIAFEKFDSSSRNKRLCKRNGAKVAAEVLPCTDAKCVCDGQLDEEAALFEYAKIVKEIEKLHDSDPVRKFMENTAAQLKEVLKSRKWYTLLRDCTLDELGFTHWGHKASIDIVIQKAQVVLIYCTKYLEYYNEPDGRTHLIVSFMLANPLRYPNLDNSVVKCLLQLAGEGIPGSGCSRATVARYLSEYKYFDAQFHGKAVTEPIKGQLYGRAINCPPGGKGGFHSDRRGKHVHPNFLWNQPGLKAKVKAYMISLGSKFPSLPLY